MDIINEAFLKFGIIDENTKRRGLSLYFPGGSEKWQQQRNTGCTAEKKMQSRIPQLVLASSLCETDVSTPTGTSGTVSYSPGCNMEETWSNIAQL
jgi:hypothetical protein